MNAYCVRCQQVLPEDWAWRWAMMQAQTPAWPTYCEACAGMLGSAIVRDTYARTDSWQRTFRQANYDMLKQGLPQYLEERPQASREEICDHFRCSYELLERVIAVLNTDQETGEEICSVQVPWGSGCPRSHEQDAT